MLRIVAGELGGRRISAPPGRGTRPTREMVREAWFSALASDVPGARVLDLFAGSGALGLEALSRGARSVVFVESDGRAAGVLRENVERLDLADRAVIRRDDVGSYLERPPGDGGPFDLALADPPYGTGWVRRLVERFRESPFARLLCVEHAPEEAPEGPDVVWQRSYGDSSLTFLAAREPRAAGGGDDAEEAP